MKQIINKTLYGTVFTCSRCEKIHVEFNNINFNFTEKEYRQFVRYLNELDGSYWEEKNKNSLFRRKIRIPFSGTSLCLMLNSEELSSLRSLLASFVISAKEELLIRFRERQCFN